MHTMILAGDREARSAHLSTIRRTFPFALLIAAASAWAQAPAIPDTPAGHVLKAWLDAFNSGDLGYIKAYVEKFEPNNSADDVLSFSRQTGGFELLSIDKSDPLHINFRVKEKASPTTAVGRLKLKSADPPQVATLILRAIPPGTAAGDIHLEIDAATRARVIQEAISALQKYYVYPETAQKMSDAVLGRQKKGEYELISDGEDFAEMLTDNLRAVSHDRHLRVSFSPTALPADDNNNQPTPEDEARERAQAEVNNCFFERAERLAGNIGYLKFNAFASPNVCAPTATAAMNFLEHVDAIIFDLRQNGGGDPLMVAFLSSYLFDKSTHLNDLYNREKDSTRQYWTLPYVPGKRLADKPVFVLTSKRTFSAAEEFTYNLKSLKRATIVGETTAGGAHPVEGHRIEDHFTIGVPEARAINPITKTNWEGTGVEPDVKVTANEALETAIKLAKKEIGQENSMH